MPEISPPTQPTPLTPDMKLLRLESARVQFPSQPTKLTFLLSRHQNAEDLPANLPELVEESDVVLIELLCWSRINDYERLNSVSLGDKTALEAAKRSAKGRDDEGYTVSLTEALFDSGKPVRFPDFPDSRNNFELYKNGAELDDSFFANAVNLASTIRASRAAHMKLIELNWYSRDKRFLRTIYPNIIEPFEAEGRSEPIKALFPIGGIHRTLPHVLRRQAAAQGKETAHSITEIMYGDTGSAAHDLYLEYLQKNPLVIEIY